MVSVALPSYTTYQKRAKSAEAKSVLGSIYVAMHAHKAEKGTFNDIPGGTDQLNAVGFEFGNLNHYEKIGFADSFLKEDGSIETSSGPDNCEPDAQTFTAGAEGDDDVNEFHINENRVIASGGCPAAPTPPPTPTPNTPD